MKVPTSYSKKAASDAEIAAVVNAANNSESYEIVAELLALTNEPDYNLLKLAEETAELQEVLIKTYTKIEEKKPTDEKLVEELGDVIFRIMVFSLQRGEEFQEALEYRLMDKSAKLLQYFLEGKYKGGI